MAERVEVVEERVRVDLALERQQLRLGVHALKLVAALAVAAPLLYQEQRFVDVRDERDRGDDDRDGHGDRRATSRSDP